MAKKNSMIFQNKEVNPNDWRLWKGQGEAASASEQFPYMAFIPCEGITSNTSGLQVEFDTNDPTITAFAPFAETVDGGINIFANRQLAKTIIIPQIVCDRN